jgi:GNAT superfamily N-acetyltransferase
VTVQIVKLKEEDRGHVRALELFVIKEFLESSLNRKWEELPQDFIDQLGASAKQSWEHYLDGGLCYVAKEKGQVVGFIFAKTIEHVTNIPLVVWVENMGVHPSHRRHGIGYQLLRKVATEGKKQGAKAVESMIMHDNAKSIMLHKKAGFFLDARRVMFLDLEKFK